MVVHTVAAVPRFLLLHGFARAYQRRPSGDGSRALGLSGQLPADGYRAGRRVTLSGGATAVAPRSRFHRRERAKLVTATVGRILRNP